MGLLYKRKENETEIVITYTYKAIIYFIAVLALLLSFMDVNPMYGLLSAITFLILLIFGFWKPNREIKKAMKNKHVEASGNNYSLRNPIVYRIKK